VPDGDATLLPQRMQSARMNEVARTFGADFADALADLPVGEWQGPIASTYGLHLVQLQESRRGGVLDGRACSQFLGIAKAARSVGVP